MPSSAPSMTLDQALHAVDQVSPDPTTAHKALVLLRGEIERLQQILDDTSDAQAPASSSGVTETSPVLTHRAKLRGQYTAAQFLQATVLSLWNGHDYPIGLHRLATTDAAHFRAFVDLVTSYWRRGASDADFMAEAAQLADIRAASESAAHDDSTDDADA